MGIEINTIYCEDCLETLKRMPDNFVNCVITSPPYWGLRDYGVDGQLGLEKTPEEYVEKMVAVFREVKRVLKPSGTVWLNLGDSYAGAGGMGSFVDGKAKKGMIKIDNYVRNKPIPGLKPKDLVGIPWRVAFSLQADGWWLRQDIIWAKPNPMPESVKDRCTKSHEYIFLLTKSAKYYYDAEAIMEFANYDGRKDEIFKGAIKDYDGVIPNAKAQTFIQGGHNRWNKNDDGIRVRNKRSVWEVATEPCKEAHFAVFPQKLIEPCVLAGCPEGGIIYDPFMGAGTTALVALRANRQYIGSELNPEYVKIAEKRINAIKNQIRIL